MAKKSLKVRSAIKAGAVESLNHNRMAFRVQARRDTSRK